MQKLSCYLILFLLLLSMSCSNKTNFEKTFGGDSDDGASCVQQTKDEGYIIVGYTESKGAGKDDIYLIKTDAMRNKEWEKTFGGIKWDIGTSVQQTKDDGYIIIGHTASKGAGKSDVYLIKTDKEGNTLWEKTFGGSDDDEGFSVQQTKDEGYIITGATTSKGAGEWDVYLIKTDKEGNTLWEKTFGGYASDEGFSAQEIKDEGYIIIGYTYSKGAGGNDVYLIKTDKEGNALWEKTFGGSDDDEGYSVQETKDEGYIITGYTYNNGEGDVYLIKTDKEGNTLWEKTFGKASDDGGLSVQQTKDDGYIITGYTYSEGETSESVSYVYLIKTDEQGNKLFEKTFGGASDDGGLSVQQTNDNGYIIAGYTQSSNDAGNSDVYLIKTDELGNVGKLQK